MVGLWREGSRVRILSQKKIHSFQIEQKPKSPLFSNAHKCLNLKILIKIFFPNFITLWYLTNEHHLKLIDFLVNYTNTQQGSSRLGKTLQSSTRLKKTLQDLTKLNKNQQDSTRLEKKLIKTSTRLDKTRQDLKRLDKIRQYSTRLKNTRACLLFEYFRGPSFLGPKKISM